MSRQQQTPAPLPRPSLFYRCLSRLPCIKSTSVTRTAQDTSYSRYPEQKEQDHASLHQHHEYRAIEQNHQPYRDTSRLLDHYNPEQKEVNGYGTSDHDYQAWDERSKAHDHIRDTAPSANELHQRLDALSAQIQALRQTAEQVIARDNEHSQMSHKLEQHKDSSTWETKSSSI